jgi:DNA polymerase
MTPESVTAELSDLLKQAQEQLTYFQELGVTGVEPIPALSLQEVPPQPSSAPTQPSKPPQAFDSLFNTSKPEQVLSQSTESLEQIWAELRDCTRCSLHEGRTHVVNTEGNRRARLMFVGEAPGADEDAQARPFVGRAGQLLTKIIEAIGLKREDVLIGNVNRCRPPANRAPMPDEAATCKPFLLREIASVQPEVIVVLGNTAMKNLLDTKIGITRLRGEFQDFRGIKVMPTFHPAFLLRDPSKKREVWEDLKKVRDYLDRTAKRPK